MITDVYHYRQELSTFIESLLVEKSRELSLYRPYGTDVVNKLSHMATKGKLFRGSLVLYAFELLSGNEATMLLPVAASMEFLHTALLIHDDIMDNSSLRRNRPTMHVQYADEIGGTENEKAHFGISQAINVGDIALFFSQELLFHPSLPENSRMIAGNIFSKEIVKIGLMQMADVRASSMYDMLSETEIESIYTYKTARYTFSLPLLLAGIFSGVSSTVQNDLATFGEKLGIIFQLKDDELDLFGDSAAIGKDVGSDIREGKQTIHMRYLFDAVSGRDMRRLHELFGKKDISEPEIEEVRDMLRRYAIDTKIQQRCIKLSEEAAQILTHIDLPDTIQKDLSSLLSLINRTQ